MFKKTLVDSLRVAEVCGEKWDAMRGSDQVRFCSHCSKNVNNISAMTRKDAMRTLRNSDGNLCIRYVTDNERSAPAFAKPLLQIKPLRPRLAAGVFSATLALASAAIAQETPQDRVAEVVEEIPRHDDEDAEKQHIASLSGVVLDLNGRGVPGVTVWLKSSGDYSYSEHAQTDESGVYSFTDMEAGTYAMRIYSAGGTWKKAMPVFEVAEGQQVYENVRVVAHYQKGEKGEGVGNGGGSGYGGAMAMTPYELPINYAIFREDVELVRQLIEENADVNAKDENYKDISPIFVATEIGNIEIVRMLLDAGAHVNVVDKTNRTPLMFLDEDATPELIQMLITAGAGLNSIDDAGYTPLLHVWSSLNDASLVFLIAAGADVNAKTNTGETTLMLAAEDGSIVAAEALILAGADVRERSDDGQSAWDRTTEPEMERLLEEHGAEADFGPVKVTVDASKPQN